MSVILSSFLFFAPPFLHLSYCLVPNCTLYGWL